MLGPGPGDPLVVVVLALAAPDAVVVKGEVEMDN